MAEVFLCSGFDIDSQVEQRTVLHASANAGNAEVVRWLLQHGAAVNVRGRMGRTPLHLAAERNRSPRVVRVLLEHGASLSAKDDLGMTPLDVARHHGQTSLESWLKAQKDP
jgi:ankyrin repeat protein